MATQFPLKLIRLELKGIYFRAPNYFLYGSVDKDHIVRLLPPSNSNMELPNDVQSCCLKQ